MSDNNDGPVYSALNDKCGSASWIWTGSSWMESGFSCLTGCVRGAGPTGSGSYMGQQVTTDCVPV